MHRVLEHVDRHLDEPLDLETLAGVANFSAFHFHRLFSAWMGETLGEYLRRRRLELAALRLVSQPDLPVLHVALSVGFGSPEAFARAFKSRFGASPTVWRSKERMRHRKRGQANRKPSQAASKRGQAKKNARRNHGVSRVRAQEATMNVTLVDRQPASVAYFRHVGPETIAQVRRAIAAAVVALTAAATLAASAQSSGSGGSTRRECVMLQALDGSAPYVSDAAECAVPTAPASTFKIPHSLIALETGVVQNAFDLVKWDRSPQPFPAWERDHSLDSAVKASVVWFFRRTAALIGRERMIESLKNFEYSADSFDADLTMFWLNGDLVVSPREQMRFLGRLMRHDLPVKPQHT